MRYLGMTDEVTACDCCGKSDLQRTVAFETEDGEVVHYGTTCAARHTGKSVQRWQGEAERARKAEEERRRMAVESALMQSSEMAALNRLRAELRAQGITCGIPFRNATSEAWAAVERKRAELMAI